MNITKTCIGTLYFFALYTQYGTSVRVMLEKRPLIPFGVAIHEAKTFSENNPELPLIIQWERPGVVIELTP